MNQPYGQGVLGLLMLMFLGIGFTCFRLLLGTVLFIAFKYGR
jgi:hypothetical protein